MTPHTRSELVWRSAKIVTIALEETEQARAEHRNLLNHGTNNSFEKCRLPHILFVMQ